MNLSFLRPRTNARHATPQHQPAPVSVNVMATLREPIVDALAYEPDAAMARQIRDSLHNREPSANLTAARHASQLASYHRYLTDPVHNKAPDMVPVIEALAFGADFIFDRISIA